MSAVLHGRTALVTGASRGIGRAIALRLGGMGARVAVNYRGNERAAAEVVEQLDGAVAVQADVLDTAGVRALFDRAEDALGGLDIVVLNAAAPRYVPTLDASDDDVEEGFVRITRAGIVALQEAGRRTRDGGRIIVISSGAARSPQPTAALYGASKVALDYVGSVLAKELGPRGVTVNSVAPGLTDTEGMILPREQADALVAATPLGRLGRPEDVADVVALVASPDAHWLTNQFLGAGGGLV